MKLKEMFGEYTPDPYDDPVLQKLYQEHAPEGMDFNEWIYSDEGREVIQDYAEGESERRDPYGHRGLSRNDFM